MNLKKNTVIIAYTTYLTIHTTICTYFHLLIIKNIYTYHIHLTLVYLYRIHTNTNLSNSFTPSPAQQRPIHSYLGGSCLLAWSASVYLFSEERNLLFIGMSVEHTSSGIYSSIIFICVPRTQIYMNSIFRIHTNMNKYTYTSNSLVCFTLRWSWWHNRDRC